MISKSTCLEPQGVSRTIPQDGNDCALPLMSMVLLSSGARTLRYHPRQFGTLLRRSPTVLSPIRRASTASRKQVTVVNDDGRVQWGELSVTEKIARTTQKTFHLGIILTGLVMTVENPKGSMFAQKLTLCRQALDISSIQRCFHPRAKRVISTRQWMRYVPMQEFKNCLGRAIRSELLESRHRINGLGQDLLRRSVYLKSTVAC